MKTHRLAVVSIVVTIAVIAWGAFVRASGSGAGCGAHWPLCNGEVVPRPEALETIVELTHRVTSGLALLLVFGLAVVVFRRTRPGDPARPAALASAFFMVTEAAIGAGLVLLELVADNDSMARAAWMAGHLMNTFFLLAALAATAWWTGPGVGRRITRPAGPWTLAIAALALGAVLLVGASGGVAALGDTLYPADSLAGGIRDDFSPGAALLVRLRVIHPTLAVLVGGFLLFAVPYLGRSAGDSRGRRVARIAVTLVLVQLVAGMVNLVLLAPIALQIVHLVLADALWIALVILTLEALSGSGTSVAPDVPARHAHSSA